MAEIQQRRDLSNNRLGGHQANVPRLAMAAQQPSPPVQQQQPPGNKQQPQQQRPPLPQQQQQQQTPRGQKPQRPEQHAAVLANQAWSAAVAQDQPRSFRPSASVEMVAPAHLNTAQAEPVQMEEGAPLAATMRTAHPGSLRKSGERPFSVAVTSFNVGDSDAADMPVSTRSRGGAGSGRSRPTTVYNPSASDIQTSFVPPPVAHPGDESLAAAETLRRESTPPQIPVAAIAPVSTAGHSAPRITAAGGSGGSFGNTSAAVPSVGDEADAAAVAAVPLRKKRAGTSVRGSVANGDGSPTGEASLRSATVATPRETSTPKTITSNREPDTAAPGVVQAQTTASAALTAATPAHAPAAATAGPGEQLFVAVHTFQATKALQVSFEKGEVLQVIKTHPKGWWFARIPSGEVSVHTFPRCCNERSP